MVVVEGRRDPMSRVGFSLAVCVGIWAEARGTNQQRGGLGAVVLPKMNMSKWWL